MASPITTQGFAVQERLQPQYADPRLLTPRYDQIIPAFSQGLGVAGQYSQMAEDARMRPSRERLQQLQIQAAEQRGALLPLELQRRRFELTQPIERVVGSGIAEVPRYPEIQSIGDNGQMITERPAGADVFATEEVEVIDPTTSERKTITRRTKPLQTMEQAENAQSLIQMREDAANAATERLRLTGLYNDARSENERIRADAAMTKAKYIESNPAFGYVDVKKEDGRTYRQYFQKTNPGVIVEEVDRGALGGGGAFEMLLNMVGQGGGAALPTLPGSQTADKFITGQTYTDAAGNKAKYLGNGRWDESR
jgi:hypothetical protein